jgi:hypothetical protein
MLCVLLLGVLMLESESVRMVTLMSRLEKSQMTEVWEVSEDLKG